MAFSLPRVNTQATIGPTQFSPTQVPTGPDPVLAIEQQAAKNLSSRMSQMSNAAFKIANKKAETKGAAFGALNAPTAEQIELAQAAGKPITLADLPGDPTSISVMEQAASAGAMAVVEDRLEMAGRKSLTEVTLAAASNPDMTPAQFGAAIDDVVQSYTQAMENISPGSAAKISASLAMVANSQAISFTRSYATTQKRLRKDESLANVNEIIASFPDIISGHDANAEPTDGSSPATLAEKLDLTRLRSMLENGGHNETKIKSTLERARAAISKAKTGAFSAWANGPDFVNDPTGARRAIQAMIAEAQGMTHSIPSTNVPPHLKEIWASMNDTERDDAWAAVNRAQQAQASAFNFEEQQEIRDNEVLKRAQTKAFNAAYLAGNPMAMKRAINAMEAIDPDTAQTWRKMMHGEAGAIENNQEHMRILDDMRRRRVLTAKAIERSHLTNETKGRYLRELETQLDARFTSAELIALGYFQPPPETSTYRLTEMQNLALRKYRAFIAELHLEREKAAQKGVPFDPIEMTEALKIKIEKEANAEAEKRYTAAFQKGLDALLDPKESDDIDTLRAAVVDKKRYEGRRLEFIQNAIKAWEVLESLGADPQ